MKEVVLLESLVIVPCQINVCVTWACTLCLHLTSLQCITDSHKWRSKWLCGTSQNSSFFTWKSSFWYVIYKMIFENFINYSFTLIFRYTYWFGMYLSARKLMPITSLKRFAFQRVKLWSILRTLLTDCRTWYSVSIIPILLMLQLWIRYVFWIKNWLNPQKQIIQCVPFGILNFDCSSTETCEY